MNNTAPMRGFESVAPHHLIHNFLGEELIQRLLAHVEAHKAEFLPTRIGKRDEGKVDPTIRTSGMLRNFGPLKQELESRFYAALEPAARELQISPIDLARLEIELVAYGNGGFYKRHIDTATDVPDAVSDRALTAVYYFHDIPKHFSGGALRLFSIVPTDRGGTFTDIEPERDMLLLFPSWAPHEVRPVTCPSEDFLHGRFAINCWYRNRRAVSTKMPAALQLNPLIDAIVDATNGATRINISAYRRDRGFFQHTLEQGRDACFDAAARVINCGATNDLTAGNLTSIEMQDLWNAGLLADATDRSPLFVTAAATSQPDVYAARGFTGIQNCITPTALSALLSYYRSAFDKGIFPLVNTKVERFGSHNDPAGRVMQRALLKTVERIIGKPIKGSYTYASLYCAGAHLSAHTDRPQCQYTVSLLLDHQPAPLDGRSPWPLHIYHQPDAPPLEYFLTLGGGVLFRGREILHGRPRLPENETCWVLLLHYVDADFEGSLD